MGPARAIFIGGFCVSQRIWRLPASAINLSRARGPNHCAVAALGTGLGCRNGRGRPRFRGPPAIGETPCRLKPRPTGPRAPGGRWVCGGFLRPAVCYGPARLALDRRSSAGAGGAALAWLGSATAGHSGKPHAPLFRGNCAGGAVEHVGQLLQPNQLISRRFEACQSWFG